MFGQAISFRAPVQAYERGPISTQWTAGGLAVGDFNGDGRLDLLDIPRSDSGISSLLIALANGDGTYTAVNPLPNVQGVLGRPAVADFNGDGRLDVAALQTEGLAVLLGNGDGTLGSPVVTALDRSRASSPIAADLNGDGNIDMVSGEYVLLGNGAGAFTVTTGFKDRVAILADLNGDGKVDALANLGLWSVHGGSAWEVYVGAGDGTFAAQGRAGMTLSGNPILVGDFDGDGALDLVFDTAYGAHVLTADVNFRRWNAYGTIFGAADFDGDGNLDLVVGNAVYAGDGKGGTKGPIYFGVAEAPCPDDSTICAANISAAVVADFSGDGKPDIAVKWTAPGFPGYRVTVLRNDSPGDGLFTAGVSAASFSAPVALGSLVTAFGRNLAPETAAAPSAPLPTTLGGVRVHVKGAGGQDLLAPLSYVSPEQINYVLPGDATVEPGGAVLVTIERVGTQLIPKGVAVPLVPTALGFFSADSDGRAAASALRILEDGTHESVPVTECAGAVCRSVPIDVKRGPVYLTLYGTGIGLGATDYQCRVERSPVTVTYLGPQLEYPGLDQVNLLLPSTLPSGVSTVRCIHYEEWFETNGVQIEIQ